LFFILQSILELICTSTSANLASPLSEGSHVASCGGMRILLR
jgi:hypothetical protein